MAYLGYKRRVRRPFAKKRPAMMRKRYPSMKKLVKKVNRISHKINREKEVKQYTPSSLFAGTVGQVDVNANGVQVWQLQVCNIPEGVGPSERIGIITKFIGTSIRLQFSHQPTATSMNKVILDVWKTQDFSYSDAALRDLLYNVDSMSGVVDANSTRNNEVIKSKSNPTGMFSLVKSKTIKVKADNTTSEIGFQDCKMFIKQQQKLNYVGVSTGVPQNVRYFIIFRCQNGNRNGGTPSTLTTIPILTAATGLVVRGQHTDYYTDN